MSFRDDLQAWTQAQFNLLYRRRKRPLADDINKLLRDRLPKYLTIKDGTAILAEFLRTAGRMPGGPYGDAIYDSGLLYVVNTLNPVVGTLLEEVFPRKYVDDINVFGGWQPSTRLGKSFVPVASRYNEFIKWSKSPLSNKGTMYSGRMREIVQIIGGSGVPIEYNFQWAESHGIFVNQIDGAWWVIEISLDNGVLAWPLYKGRDLSDEEIALDVTIPYVPNLNRQKLPGSVLISPAGLADAFDGAPYYTEMCWAFSYTGNQAQNITVTIDGGGVYLVAKRWSITIDADEITGAPTSAALNLEESKFLWNNNQSACPKYPHITEEGFSLLSFDTKYGVSTPPAGEYDAPVDVFFVDGNDEPVVVRQTTVGENTSVTSPAETWPPPGVLVNSCEFPIPFDMTWAGVHLLDTSGLETTTESNHYAITGIDEAFEATPVYSKSGKNYVKIDEWTKDADHCWAVSGSAQYVWAEHYVTNWHAAISGQNSYFSSTREEAFFKPFFDRETFALYVAQKDQEMTPPTRNYYAGGPAGIRYEYVFTITALPGKLFWGPPPPLCDNGAPVSTDLGTLTDPSGAASVGQKTVADVSTYLWTAAESGCSIGISLTQFTLGDTVLKGRDCNWTGNSTAVALHSTLEKQEIYVFNPKTKEFIKVFESDVYPTVETAYTAFYPGIEDGSLLFCTYSDAFTGQGMLSSEINKLERDDLHDVGTIMTYYDLDHTPGLVTSWYGIPLPVPPTPTN